MIGFKWLFESVFDLMNISFTIDGYVLKFWYFFAFPIVLISIVKIFKNRGDS